jgi:hypothetical protein
MGKMIGLEKNPERNFQKAKEFINNYLINYCRKN